VTRSPSFFAPFSPAQYGPKSQLPASPTRGASCPTGGSASRPPDGIRRAPPFRSVSLSLSLGARGLAMTIRRQMILLIATPTLGDLRRHPRADDVVHLRGVEAVHAGGAMTQTGVDVCVPLRRAAPGGPRAIAPDDRPIFLETAGPPAGRGGSTRSSSATWRSRPLGVRCLHGVRAGDGQAAR